ncbi:BrnT family toxin [Azospirillum sp. SYSU D00513]|uniref:BrnT family toxin n=1 Tax=Azospirillum sp. SYSU D00513 TaxID=2812561 RepID=UPI001A9690BF|nr:BrnT family toxin [Azospirillum sp. SYSU D00513]
MYVDFDPAKSEKNERERGLPFPAAARIFLGSTVEWDDLRHKYGERRIIAVGMVQERPVKVVYTWRLHEVEGPFRWIISAHVASRKERRRYAAYFPE